MYKLIVGELLGKKTKGVPRTFKPIDIKEGLTATQCKEVLRDKWNYNVTRHIDQYIPKEERQVTFLIDGMTGFRVEKTN